MQVTTAMENVMHGELFQKLDRWGDADWKVIYVRGAYCQETESFICSDYDCIAENDFSIKRDTMVRVDFDVAPIEKRVRFYDNREAHNDY